MSYIYKNIDLSCIIYYIDTIYVFRVLFRALSVRKSENMLLAIRPQAKAKNSKHTHSKFEPLGPGNDL